MPFDTILPEFESAATYRGIAVDSVNNTLKVYNWRSASWTTTPLGGVGAGAAAYSGTMNILNETFSPYSVATSNLTAIGTGTAIGVAIALKSGQRVSNLSIMSGDTAAGTPTHWALGLYSTAATPALVANTADQTSTAFAANTVKTVAVTTPYVVPSDGVYVIAFTMTASTVITMEGLTQRSTAGGAFPLATAAGGWASAGQTFGSTLNGVFPSTLTGGSATASRPWMAVS